LTPRLNGSTISRKRPTIAARRSGGKGDPLAKKILIFETDAFYVEVVGTFVRLFLQHGFLATRTADEALEAVQRERPDLVILDIDVGFQEATDFAEKMRDDAATKRIPIIAIAQDESRRDQALGAGCSAFLAKPFKVRDLESLISRLLSDAEK